MVVTINPYCRVTLEVQGDVVNNTSTVRVTKLELRNPDGTNVGNCWVLGEIRLGGMLAANMILNNTQSCALTFYSRNRLKLSRTEHAGMLSRCKRHHGNGYVPHDIPTGCFQNRLGRDIFHGMDNNSMDIAFEYGSMRRTKD